MKKRYVVALDLKRPNERPKRTTEVLSGEKIHDHDAALVTDFSSHALKTEKSSLLERRARDPQIDRICARVYTAIAEKDFDQAEELIQQFSELYPDEKYADIEHRLCLDIIAAKIIAGHKVDMKVVLAYIEELHEEYRRHAKIHFSMSEVYRAAGMYAQALECFKTVKRRHLSSRQLEMLDPAMEDCRAHMLSTGPAVEK